MRNKQVRASNRQRARSYKTIVKRRGTNSILKSRYEKENVTPNVQGRDVEFHFKRLEFMRLEIVYRLLNICNDALMLSTIFGLFPDVDKGALRGYIKFLMDKGMMFLEYHIMQGHKVPFYTTTNKGKELRTLMSLIYNILEV